MRRPLLLHPSRHGTLIKPSGEKNDRKSRPGRWLPAPSSRGSHLEVSSGPVLAVSRSRRVLSLLTVTFPATLSSSLTLAQTISRVKTNQLTKQANRTMTLEHRRSCATVKENTSSTFWMYNVPKTFFCCEKFEKVTH